MTATLQDFDYVTSDHSLGFNRPQQMGRRLWFPMFVMALMAFAVGFILGIIRADEIATGGSEETITRLGHLVPAFMFLGFMALFTAVSFAISRILGEFRAGGGDVQEAAGGEVYTLRMPPTATAFMLLMMMGMMTLLVSVVLHFVAAAAVGAGNPLEQEAIWLEGFRRIGVTMYLFGISLGLATIIYVLRFQAIRLRQLAEQRGPAHE